MTGVFSLLGVSVLLSTCCSARPVPDALFFLAQMRDASQVQKLSQAGASAVGKQAAEVSTAPDAVPSVVLEFTKSEPIPISLAGQTISGFFSCASDGSVVFELVNFGSPDKPLPQPDFTIFAVQNADHVTRFGFASLGLKRMNPVQTWSVTSGELTAILKAVTPDEETKDNGVKKHLFLVRFNRDGSFNGVHPIEGITDISSMGVFPSGEILVAGIDPMRHSLSWKVLDASGAVLREVTPVNGKLPKDSVEELLTDDPWSLVPQIVPYQDHLLSVAMGGKEIVEWNPSGVIRTTRLQIPGDTQTMKFIPSNGRNWLVTFGRKGVAPEGGGPVGFKAAGIGEFDPGTGELLRVFHSESRRNGSTIACVRDGVFQALSTDPESSLSLVLETGTEAH